MYKIFLIKKMIRGRKIHLNDYTQYEPCRGRNGGCYGFWQIYKYTFYGVTVRYGTTSDLPWCPYCGSFVETEKCLCGRKEQYISLLEFWEIFKNFPDKSGYFIEYS